MAVFNIGTGFIAFGLMLWLYQKLSLIGEKNRITVQARIIGYKQFATDTTITNNNIHRGQNFSWLRVVSFKNPKTGQMLEMYSNPSAVNPEPIDTVINVTLDPNKIDPIKDFVWVKNGMQSVKSIGKASAMVGVVLFVVLLFFPESSPVHLLLVVPGFFIVFITTYITIWKRPNQ